MAVKILIPYHFTMNDEKSIDFVGHRYAGKKDIEITMIRNTSYLRQQQDEQKNALEAARQKLMDYGFAGQHIHCRYIPIRQDIARDIIWLWKTEKFDVVVLNRNPGNIINYFSRSISKRVTRHVEGGDRGPYRKLKNRSNTMVWCTGPVLCHPSVKGENYVK